jgi:PmbA protein
MAYIDEIEAGFARHPQIADYRVNLAAGRSYAVGIRDNDVGSVYSPLSFSDTVTGSFLLQWRDGRLSRGNLDGNSLQEFDQVVARARAAAYDDPDAAQFLGPQQVRPVETSSPDVPPLFGERAGLLLEVVSVLREGAERYGARTLNGGTGASMGESWIRTSHGLDLHGTSTSFSFSASFDGIIGDGMRRRKLIALDEIRAEVARIGAFFEHLQRPAMVSESRDRVIVLHPNVAYSLFDFFVWGNMGGSAVFHGQSPWSKDDFVTKRQILREDFQVNIDPWQPLGSGSFGWTGEGLPSAPVTYVDGGRLVSPILDLKYAKRLDLPPLTPPGNEHSVHLEAGEKIDADEFIAGLTDGLLVLSVLGLHTQDRTSGNYSLSAPQTLLIRDGEIRGKVKVTLSGNFLDHLRDGATRLVRFVGQHSPGFAFPGNATIEAD